MNMSTAQLAATIDLQSHIEACLDYEKTNGLKERSLKSIRSYLNNFADYLEKFPIDDLSSITPDYLRAFIIDRTESVDPETGRTN